jgi:hypothetical protein
VVRTTTVLLVCAGGLAACAVGPKLKPLSTPQAPSITAVVNARFATAVELDHGGLLVTPPSVREARTATVTESEADAMFEATDAVAGAHPYAILGLGLVTVATGVEEPSTTTTTPPPTSSLPPTTVGAPVSTTSDATTSPTTTVGAPPSTALPTYHRRLAWVGIVWGPPGACTGSTTTTPATAEATTYIAVIIDATTGHGVLAYRSGGSSPCTGTSQAPAVTEPNELLSVPWQAVGPTSTAVQIEVPPCGHYYGWTQVPAAGGATAAQVVVTVPFDPTCGATTSQSQAIDQVVPLGSNPLGHAPVGPVQALQALPSD